MHQDSLYFTVDNILLLAVHSRHFKGPKLRAVLDFRNGSSGIERPKMEELHDRYNRTVRLSTVEVDNGTSVLSEYTFGGAVYRRCSSDSLRDCPDPPVEGSTLRIAYDSWYPVFYATDDGSFAGLMHDVTVIVAARLNVTVEFVENDMVQDYTFPL